MLAGCVTGGCRRAASQVGAGSLCRRAVSRVGARWYKALPLAHSACAAHLPAACPPHLPSPLPPGHTRCAVPCLPLPPLPPPHMQTSAWSMLCGTPATSGTWSPSRPMPARRTRSSGIRWATGSCLAHANTRRPAPRAAPLPLPALGALLPAERDKLELNVLSIKGSLAARVHQARHDASCIREFVAPAIAPAGQPGSGGRVLPAANDRRAGSRAGRGGCRRRRRP